MSERLEPFDPFYSIEPVESPTSLSDLQIQDIASEFKVFKEFAPLEGDSEAIPPAGEPTLSVPCSKASLGEADQAEGTSVRGLWR